VSPAGRDGVSLIIPSRGRASLLRQAVEAVLRRETVPDEIVVVDQSEEADRELPRLANDRPCAIRYIHSRSRGSSAARNEGVRAATGTLLLFIDDDMVVAAAWLAAMTGALRDRGPGVVVTGRVAPLSVSDEAFVPSTTADDARAEYVGRLDRDVLYAGNMGLHRDVVTQIGEFDERLGIGAPFRGAEDNDFGFRLLEAGFRIAYVPEALAYHVAWRDRRAQSRVHWNYGVGQGAFYAKHLAAAEGHVARRLVRDVRRHAVRMAKSVRRDPSLARDEAVYLVGVGTGFAGWLLTQNAGRRRGRQRRSP
jgi:GT2 family glycosyltransferase